LTCLGMFTVKSLETYFSFISSALYNSQHDYHDIKEVLRSFDKFSESSFAPQDYKGITRTS